MIPQSAIDHWKTIAPWSTDLQVEQDLVVSRAVAEIFSDDQLRDLVAIRGGTVLNKFYFGGGSRYSEDIDLVLTSAERAGTLYERIRPKLDPWLGNPKRERSESSVKLLYRFQSEADPAINMRLKVEINTQEHFSVLGYQEKPFRIDNPWHSSQTSVNTFSLNELLGTKMRALYQRKKGRDLFDLWYALTFCSCDPEVIIDCFVKYMMQGNNNVRRAEFEANLQNKRADRYFLNDITALIRTGLNYDPETAFNMVLNQLVFLIPN